MGAPTRYEERRIKTVDELRDLIKTLDLDEGIRIRGDLKAFPNGGFIFITKMGNRYTINTTEQILHVDRKTYVPGGAEKWFFASTPDETWVLIMNKITSPLEAWIY